jgi:hypothetical protein
MVLKLFLGLYLVLVFSFKLYLTLIFSIYCYLFFFSAVSRETFWKKENQCYSMKNDSKLMHEFTKHRGMLDVTKAFTKDVK